MTTYRSRITRTATRAGTGLLICTVTLVGCGLPDGRAERGAKTALAEVLEQEHEAVLRQRAVDPTATGPAAAQALAETLTGDFPELLVSQTSNDDGVEVVTTNVVSSRGDSGVFGYEAVTLGACVRNLATPGDAGGVPGERGTVVTEAVDCPDGVTLSSDQGPVDATTDVRRLKSPVPLAPSEPCFSGSGDCGGGG